MAKLTTQSFIDDHLGGASQYDEPNLRSMLGAYVSHATDSLDYELSAAGSSFDALDVRGQGIYNRVAANLVWLQIRAQQGEGEVSEDAWDSAISDIEDALPTRASLLGGTQSGTGGGAAATSTAPTGSGAAVDRAQVEAIVRDAVAAWALAGQARPTGPRGPAGPQGETGPAGPQGPQGEPGSGGNGGGLNQAQVQAVVLAAVADEAEQGNTDRWPASKLQQSSATQGGIITAAEWTRLDNSIDATTLHDQPHIDNSDIDGGVGQDSVLIDDASVTGTRSLKEVYFNELDKRWAAVDRANYLGTWVSGGQYRVGDVVQSGNEFYIAKSIRSGTDTTAPADDDEWLDITGGGGGTAPGVNLIFTYTSLPTATADSPINVYVVEDGLYHRRTISSLDTTDITFSPSAADPFSVASGTFSAQSQIPAAVRRYVESIQAVYENTLSGDRSTYNFRRGNWVAYLSPEFTAGSVTLTVGTTNVTLSRAAGTTRTHDGRTYTRYQSATIPSQANSAVILTSPYKPRIRLTFNTSVYVYDRVDIGVTDAEVDAKIAPLDARISAANRYKGAWVSGTAYSIGDVVVDGAAFFIAKTARTTANTTRPAADPEWLDMTSAAEPQAGMIVTQTEIDWGDDDIGIGVGANNVASGWTTLSSPTVGVGAHILTFRLFIEETGQAWYGIEYRIRRTRGSVVTTIEDTPRIRYNARPTGLTWTDRGGQFQSITAHFSSQAGDSFQLQARAIADNVQNVSRMINFPAGEQHIEMTTMRPAASSATAIDARIADWAQEGNTSAIPASKVTAANRYKGAWVSGNAYAVGDLVESGNKFYIARLARDSSDTTAPDSDSEWLEITSQQRSNADIDARVAAFARTGATVQIPDARLPAVLRSLPSAFGTAGQVLQVNSGATALEFADAASGGGGGDVIEVVTALPSPVTAQSPTDVYVRGIKCIRKYSSPVSTSLLI